MRKDIFYYIMKHLWIINQYALPKGSPGITRHGDFAYLLSQMGYKVTVFASGFDYLSRKQTLTDSQDKTVTTDHDGVRFVWIDTPSYQANDSKRVKNMISFFKSVMQEASFAKHGKPDVILGSSPHLLSGLAGSLLAMRYRAPFMLELRDVWPDDLVALGALSKRSVTYSILKNLAAFLQYRADKILTVPPKLHTYLANQGVATHKLTPLPNGVFLDQESQALPETLAAQFDQAKDKFKLVYMGAHGVANNLSNVLNTALYLKNYKPEQYEKLAFFFVGDGQQKEQLRAQAEELKLESVFFHAPIPKAVVPTVTAKADALLVHLHEADTFNVYGRSPNKLYDYLAAAKPVLYSTTDDRTILQKTESGLCFTPSNPKLFAETLETVLNMTDAERFTMGQNGRRAVEKEHDLKLLANRLAHVIEELSQSSGSFNSSPVPSDA